MEILGSPGPSAHKWRMALIPVVLVQLGWFLVVARHRLIDGDEGFYLMASKLIWQGQMPYRDFFFTQMPLLPVMYGLWFQIAGTSWIAARALSAFFTTILGTVMYVHVSKETGKWAAGVIAVLLLVSSTHVFAWMTIVKTYALSTLLLFLAYITITRHRSTGSQRAFGIAGLLLGLSADVRLYFAGLFPVLILWILTAPEIRARRRALVGFAAGFALAVLPNIYFFALDPSAYVFDNLGFRAASSGGGFIGDFSDKLDTLYWLFRTRGSGNGAQFGILCFLCGLGFLFRRPASARLATYIAVTLISISLLPAPSLTQYFCVAVPFLIVVAVEPLNGIRTPLAVAGASVLLLVFVAASIKDVQRFLSSGEDVIGVSRPRLAVNFRLDSVVAMSHRLDECASPGEPVMSLWPGYLVQSKTQPLPGFENNTARELTRTISSERMFRYHIVSPSRIEALLRAHIPRLVVVGNQESMSSEFDTASYERMLLESGYRRDYQLGTASLWIVGQAIALCGLPTRSLAGDKNRSPAPHLPATAAPPESSAHPNSSTRPSSGRSRRPLPPRSAA